MKSEAAQRCPFPARYYDGQTSRAHEVSLYSDGEQLHIRGEGIAADIALADVRVSSRLGDSPRYLVFPNGAKCETHQHGAVDAIFNRANTGGIAHRLERRWSFALAATVITATFVWLSVEYGLPAMARHVAHAVPVAMEQSMGQQSLNALDGEVMKESRLMEVDRERVRAAFAYVTTTLGTQHKLHLNSQLLLRRSETLGANAFALPSGIVVFTDEMVELAQNDEQLMAVIAHELGHVHHRHIMRSILQNSVTALLVATLLGDVASITGLAAAIPTFLVEQRYSRTFEFEADAFALQWMDAQQLDRQHLAQILQRLSDSQGVQSEGFEKYLSTHPSMGERIEAISRN
ncbi:MAG: Zn-dependent protease with chaperone function [Gammaproteobacteria bacterium]|jgi:Zn-dependent protease with chaperone function